VENSHFEEHLTPVATMTDNRTMAEMLRAPTEGCAEEIIVPPILAEQFELKHNLINMMTSEQFFGLEKDNPYDHVRWGSPPQKFDEYFHEAWERYKYLLRAYPHHGFTELHQLDTFYNALNPADQDSLNAAAGGNLLEKSPQDVITIIENKSKVRNSRSKLIASLVNACDNHSSFELAKLTHAVNQQTSACLAADGNTFPEYRDNIQGYVSVAACNFNQGNPGYRPQGVANQMRPPGFAQPNVQNNQNRFGQPQGQNFHLNELEKIKRMNDVSLKAMQNQIDMMNTASTSGSRTLPGNTIATPKGELKSTTTRSGLVTDGPTVPNPPKSVNPKEDKCVEETYTDPDHAEYNIKVPPPPPVQKPKSPIQRNFVLHTRDSFPPHIPYPSRLPEKLGDPEKFLIPYGFSKLKCKALADLGASINLMPLSVWKKLGDLIPTLMTLELANRAICTPNEITRDVFVPVGKFT
nr:hypothetical protein [Tanacetum cinerariifolium]